LARQVPIKEQQGEGTSPRTPSIPHALTPRQASSEPSASSASAEPAAVNVQGLQVVAEGIEPIVEYTSPLLHCSFDS
jgi:hypothetical protein